MAERVFLGRKNPLFFGDTRQIINNLADLLQIYLNENMEFWDELNQLDDEQTSPESEIRCKQSLNKILCRPEQSKSKIVHSSAARKIIVLFLYYYHTKF